MERGLGRTGGSSLGAALSFCAPSPGTNKSVLAGTARVELCEQGPADLADLDDGPYEAGGEKEQDPSLIPVPANSYLGRDPSAAQRTLTLTPLSCLPSLSMLLPFCLCLSLCLAL